MKDSKKKMALQVYRCCILSFILVTSLAPGIASDLVADLVQHIDPRESYLSAVDPTATTGSHNSNGQASVPIQMPTAHHGNIQKTLEFLDFWDSENSTYTKEDDSVFTDTDKISEWLKCDKTDYSNHEDPNAYTKIPTDQDFSVFVEAYVYAMRKNYKEPSVVRYDPTVFKVPVEVRSIPHVGRGVFAKEDIPQGTLIAKPSNSLRFSTNQEYRDFLAHLMFLESKFICDQLMWMYGTKNYDNDEDDNGNLYRVLLDADATSLINDEDWTKEEEDAYYNLGYDDDSYYDDDELTDEDAEGETTDEEDEYEYYYEDEDEPEVAAEGADDEYEDTNHEHESNAAEEERALEEEGEDCHSTNSTTGQLNSTCGASSSSNETVSEKPKKELLRFPNAGHNEGHNFKNGWIMYALKDIKAGEEIIMSYTSFAVADAFAEIELWH